MGINVAEMIADVLKNAATTAEKIQKRAKIVAQLQEAGVHVKWPEGTVRYGIPIEVNKSDLTAIRQVVGRLSISGKDTASDFNDTNEIVVTLKPSDDSPVKFSYRTKYRKGGKCKVVESLMPASICKSLVCEI